MIRFISKLVAAWPLVAKRSLAHWKVLSSVVAGVLLASVIMASTVIYLDALRDLALTHALNQRTDDQLDILATAEPRPRDTNSPGFIHTLTSRKATVSGGYSLDTFFNLIIGWKIIIDSGILTRALSCVGHLSSVGRATHS